MFYPRSDKVEVESRVLFLSGLHVLDDGRSNLPENPVAAEGAFDLWSHSQLVCCKSRPAIDAFIEQPARISRPSRWFLRRCFRCGFFRTRFHLDYNLLGSWVRVKDFAGE